MEQLTALRATRGSGGGGARPNTGGLARMLLRAIFSVAAVLLTLVAVRQTTVGHRETLPAAAWGGDKLDTSVAAAAPGDPVSTEQTTTSASTSAAASHWKSGASTATYDQSVAAAAVALAEVQEYTMGKQSEAAAAATAFALAVEVQQQQEGSLEEASEGHAVNEAVMLRGVDPRCHAEASLDLDGPAVAWGISHRTADAAECCARCISHAEERSRQRDRGGDGGHGACNSWVFCPEEVCWSPDIWNHTKGECWLKVQQDPRAPKVNFRGGYPADFRRHHSTAPPHVAWQAGVILPSAPS